MDQFDKPNCFGLRKITDAASPYVLKSVLSFPLTALGQNFSCFKFLLSCVALLLSLLSACQRSLFVCGQVPPCDFSLPLLCLKLQAPLKMLPDGLQASGCMCVCVYKHIYTCVFVKHNVYLCQCPGSQNKLRLSSIPL